MVYHHRTFERLLRRPALNLNPAAIDRLPLLPASVAEWFALPESLDPSGPFSSGDWVVHPDDFDAQIITIRPGRRDCFARGLPKGHQIDGAPAKVFLVENQGVCWWAFTDTGDDPPVYVTYRPPPENWRRCSDSFSTFVYTRIFDHIHFFEEGVFHTEVTDVVPKETIRYLDANLRMNRQRAPWRAGSNDDTAVGSIE